MREEEVRHGVQVQGGEGVRGEVLGRRSGGVGGVEDCLPDEEGMGDGMEVVMIKPQDGRGMQHRQVMADAGFMADMADMVDMVDMADTVDTMDPAGTADPAYMVETVVVEAMGATAVVVVILAAVTGGEAVRTIPD